MQSGSTSSHLNHYNTDSIKIIIMIMVESKPCVKHCYWQGEDEACPFKYPGGRGPTAALLQISYFQKVIPFLVILGI